jgi:hypothetical protein
MASNEDTGRSISRYRDAGDDQARVDQHFPARRQGAASDTGVHRHPRDGTMIELSSNRLASPNLLHVPGGIKMASISERQVPEEPGHGSLSAS